jgi:hypothetical protein
MYHIVSNQLKEWIARDVLGPRFPTHTALAAALDVQLPALSRGLDKGTFSVDTLLRLAAVTETPPSVVLRLANKNDTADLLERLYQIHNPAPLTATERRVLARFRVLTLRAQQSIEQVMSDLPTRKEVGKRRPNNSGGRLA